MTIYILDDDTKKIAEALDDKSLDWMIKDIANVFKIVHGKIEFISSGINDWSKWARQCVANYEYLVSLGMELCIEYQYRFGKSCWYCDEGYDDEDCTCLPLNGHHKDAHKKQLVIEWARDNIPDLPTWIITKGISNVYDPTPFPIVIPKKYLIMRLNSSPYGYDPQPIALESYRKYFEYKVYKKVLGTASLLEDTVPKIFTYDAGKLPKWTHREKPDWLNI